MTSITFVLITYNQQPYVKKAVESVFAQDITADQVIISDDCSTDGTYEIIQDLSSSYTSNGSLIVRQNKSNLGLVKHFNKIVELSTCELIIFAAGDDISVPSRTRKILSVYNESRPLLIHSDVFCISSNGNPVESPFGRSICPVLWDDNASLEEVASSMIVYIGATLAAPKRLFDLFGPIHYIEAYEDLVLGYRSKLYGQTRFIPDALVGYRLGAGVSWGDKNIQKVHQAVLRQRIRDTVRVNPSTRKCRDIVSRLQSRLYSQTLLIIRMQSLSDLWRHRIPDELNWSDRIRIFVHKLRISIRFRAKGV